MECVQKQTCQNIEHIIWDGASTDGTIDLIQQKISEIKGRDDYVPIVFHSEPDVGLYDAMNKAVSASAGEYVIFLNSDDLLNDPDTLALALSHIVTSSPDFAFGRTRYINEDGSEFVSKRVTTDSILRTIPFCHNSMLFRRGAFLEFGGHDLEFKVVADYDLMLRLFLSGCRTQNIPETISVFRRGGISADVTRVGHEVAQVWRKNYGRFLDMSKYPDTALLHWYKIGQLSDIIWGSQVCVGQQSGAFPKLSGGDYSLGGPGIISQGKNVRALVLLPCPVRDWGEAGKRCGACSCGR